MTIRARGPRRQCSIQSKKNDTQPAGGRASLPKPLPSFEKYYIAAVVPKTLNNSLTTPPTKSNNAAIQIGAIRFDCTATVARGRQDAERRVKKRSSSPSPPIPAPLPWGLPGRTTSSATGSTGGGPQRPTATTSIPPSRATAMAAVARLRRVRYAHTQGHVLVIIFFCWWAPTAVEGLLPFRVVHTHVHLYLHDELYTECAQNNSVPVSLKGSILARGRGGSRENYLYEETCLTRKMNRRRRGRFCSSLERRRTTRIVGDCTGSTRGATGSTRYNKRWSGRY